MWGQLHQPRPPPRRNLGSAVRSEGWWGGVPTPLLFIMAQTRVDNLRLKIRAKSDSTYGSF